MWLAKLFISCFLLLPIVLFGQLKIEGTLIDSATQKPIPFANVWHVGTSNGTLTNDLGHFSIIADTTISDSLLFGLIGYQTKQYNINLIPKLKPFYISLSPKSFELNTIIITPLSAQEYIRRALIAIEKNYDTDGRTDRYYYREVIKENGAYNRFTEAVLDVYQPPLRAEKNDTAIIRLKGGHVLDDKQYISFMRDYVKKKVEKENKKLKKEGKSTVEFDDISQYVSFANPYGFIDSNFTIKPQSFLDSNHFDKFEYRIEYGYESHGDQMLCISFNQLKKINGTFYSGNIYMVDSSYAIEGIDYGWSEKGKKKVIPAYAKAALWAFRLQVDKPNLYANIRFHETNGKWNLNHFFINLEGQLTKKYFFEDNQTSQFHINQSFVFIESLNWLNPANELLKRTMPIQKQINSSNKNLDWSKYRKLEPENLKK